MFVTMVLAVLCVSPEHMEPPFHCFTSGTEVAVAVGAPEADEIVLVAFGEVIIRGLKVRNGEVRFRVPDVRSRTVLDLRNRTRSDALVAQVAAYPSDRRIWGDERVEVCTLGTPAWFLQWAVAMGLEIRQFSSSTALRRSASKNADTRLIVLGRDSGIDHPQDCFELAQVCSANVVVLEATWYEKRVSKPVGLQIDAVPTPLRTLGEWTWRDLPRFTHYWRPRLFWMNRATVARDEERTLIELFMQPNAPHVLLASYVPWKERVGHTDGADAIFAALLRETARATPPEPFSGELVAHSGAGRLPNEHRPVLSRAMGTTGEHSTEGALQVIDLRGESENTITASRIDRLLDSATDRPVLILGDDPILQFVRGLPKPETKTKKNTNTLWLSADGLPADAAAQETLMRILTKHRIPLKSTLEDN